VAEAQQILKRHPDDLQSRRLLDQSICEPRGSEFGQRPIRTVSRGIEQSQIYGWIIGHGISFVAARLYRLKDMSTTKRAGAASILKTDPENELGGRATTQLLMDEGSPQKRWHCSRELRRIRLQRCCWTCWGMRTRRRHDLAKAERRTARRSNWDPP